MITTILLLALGFVIGRVSCNLIHYAAVHHMKGHPFNWRAAISHPAYLSWLSWKDLI